MSQLTPHLGLKKPDGSDPFLRQDFDDNYDLLDTSPGLYICTSGTHPTTWGDNQVGRAIIETDTGAVLYFRADHTFQASLAQGSGDVGTLQTVVASLQGQVGAIQSDIALIPNAQLSGRAANVTLGNGATKTFDVFGGTLPQMVFSHGGRIVIWGHVGVSMPGKTDTENRITYSITVDGSAANWGDPGSFSHYKLGSATATGSWDIDIPYMSYHDIGSAGSHNMQISVTNHDTGGNYAVTITHIKAVAILGHHNT